MKTARFILPCLFLGLLIGVTGKFFDWDALQKYFAPEEVREPSLTLPADGIQSDAWSLRVFQELAQIYPLGFTYSPLGLNIALHQLQEASSASDHPELHQLQLPEFDDGSQLANPPMGFAQILLDDQLTRCPNEFAQNIHTLPLQEDRTRAMLELYQLITHALQGTLDYPISGALLPSESKMLHYTVLSQKLQWLHPLQSNEGESLAFCSQQHSSKNIACLSSVAPYRSVNTGEYIALALFFKAQQADAKPTCMILIMPLLESLQEFVARLDADKLTRIKQELFAQIPQDIHLHLPAFQHQGQSYPLRPLLENWGLQSLFKEQAHWSHLSPTPFALTEMWHSANIKLQGSTTSPATPPNSTAPSLSINQPFLWLISDLTSNQVPAFMGTVEKL